MRLFVAVHPSPEAAGELAAVVAPLRALPGAERLRWTAEDGWHLTLAFLGSVPDDQLPALREGLSQAAAGYQAHRLRLAGGGHFGDRVLWVGLAGQTWALRSLARAVTQLAGEVLGVEEEFSYHPHLTLARTGRGGHPGREERAALRAAAEQLVEFQGVEWPVTEFQLMRSDLGSGRSRYTVVDRWLLRSEEGEWSE
ncbi:RNA 2',3'-cyclic phosphodiesterase [Kitasatospora kifunensis]|uniref:RNA 2',3'-cyclic phosphodiesterase n=1 Tax=Kitasatospora kifunensis TaxID=58351 RepID=A0A7W7VW19_KITKI|nr:RNA 2',3'-cyclic phosphodiesterase [Kitasatospora kifunensis]MBB4924090.1 2'-5' RNA ligase [Kitasatospora kifunensis]